MVEYQDESYEDYDVYTEDHQEYQGGTGEGHGTDGAQGNNDSFLQKKLLKLRHIIYLLLKYCI